MSEATHKDIRILASCQCGDCEGQGVVSNASDLWERYWLWREASSPPPSVHCLAALSRQWWSDRGYSEPPPEEGECRACDGTGRRTVELTTDQIAELILAFLPRRY